jgi:hypothetical protein
LNEGQDVIVLSEISDLMMSDLLSKSIALIADIYEKELKFITLNTQFKYYTPIETLSYITSNPDKYKWFDAFNMIAN